VEKAQATDSGQCDHCGLELTHTIIHNTKGEQFCCHGCLQVREILSGGEGEVYYGLLDAENKKAPRAKIKSSYREFLKTLEDPEQIKQQGRWNGDVHTVELISDAIQCSACGWLLEHRLAKTEGITDFYADFIHGQVRFSYDSKQVQLVEVLRALAALGYPLKFRDYENAEPVIDKALLIRLAISGAVFSNVMIFSLSLYFGVFTGIDPKLAAYFNWLSFALNLPVVTWCALPFYRKAWGGLKAGVLHMDLPVSVGIILAYGLSTYKIMQGGHSFLDSVSGLVFFLLIGRWIVQRFEQSLVPDPGWFDNMLPSRVQVRTESGIEIKAVEKLRKGDEILVEAGTLVPADSILLGGSAAFDTSLFSGESRSREFSPGSLISAGYKVLREHALLKVEKMYADSAVSKLRDQWVTLNSEKDRSSKGEKIVPRFIAVVLSLAGLAFYLGLKQGLEIAIENAAVVLILSCPCALALSRPLSMGVAMSRARQLGFLIRSATVIEKLQKVQTVFLDKTGTLTLTERRLQKWTWLQQQISGLDHETMLGLLHKLSGLSLHPVSQTLNEELEDRYLRDARVQSFKEHPHFGIEAVIEWKNQAYSVLLANTWAIKNKSAPTEIDINYDNQNLKDLPESGSCMMINGQIAAAFIFEDEVRPTVKSLPNDLKKIGVDSVLLSGDSLVAVQKFRETLSFREWHGNLSPEQKLEIVKQEQAKGKAVIAMGDGVNDALMLSVAEVGILLQGGASNLAECSDILYSGNHPGNLPDLIRLSRGCARSEQLSYFVSLSYNITVLTLAFSGYIPPLVAAIAMPLSSISVGLIALITVRAKS
jgi:cation transport ATPase